MNHRRVLASCLRRRSITYDLHRASRGALLALVAGLAIAAVTGMASAQTSGSGSTRPPERLGPKRDLAVYWVGHSLIEAKAASEWGEQSLMTLVGRFAEARSLGYRMGDHTLWGSPMSALWRGRPYGYKRDASMMVAKREAFERSANQYDALVLTEALPLQRSLAVEYSSYHLRKFYCVLKQARPEARVYLYQSWLNFQGADPNSKFPPPQRFDWRAEMIVQGKLWEDLAEAAARNKVRTPGMFDRIGWTSTSNAGCDSEAPIFIIPVGQALIDLFDRLASPVKDDGLVWPDGTRLRMADLFANPYIDWPENWPIRGDLPAIDPASALAGLTLRDGSRPHDDIHPSAIGIYFVALVHFATLYRQSPVGLPAPGPIGSKLALSLQCIAWTTAVGYHRSGVVGEAGC